eukprot:m.145919 g.145919  ORF g.145919 m.145919 type:complete len:112 (-) comp14144_c0_seq11:370-705(-)
MYDWHLLKLLVLDILLSGVHSSMSPLCAALEALPKDLFVQSIITLLSPFPHRFPRIHWPTTSFVQQLDVLKTWGTTVVDPVSKVLACGDQGVGAMAHVDDIVAKVQGVFSL